MGQHYHGWNNHDDSYCSVDRTRCRSKLLMVSIYSHTWSWCRREILCRQLSIITYYLKRKRTFSQLQHYPCKKACECCGKQNYVTRQFEERNHGIGLRINPWSSRSNRTKRLWLRTHSKLL